MASREHPVPRPGATRLTQVIDTVRAVGVAAVIVSICFFEPGPATPGARGTAIAATLAVCGAAWIAWMTTGRWPRVQLAALVVLGVTGGLLPALAPNSPALAIGCVVTFTAGAQLGAAASAPVLAAVIVPFLIAAPQLGASAGTLVGYPFVFAAPWSLGLTRRQSLVRAEQAEHTLAETRRAREAETQAAALAERARIARDIHDVLAHSLAAVSVNLQAAEGLLTADTLPGDDPSLVKAVECVERAGTLTREGLAAARRAVLALREDGAPLPDQLAELARQYRAPGDTKLDLEVAGEPRPLAEKTVQVAYRTAQEALTNARKHAPGQPVTLTLTFGPQQLALSVVNQLPPGAPPGPLAATGAGYGLTGLRERAQEAGGTLETGPAAGAWRVSLRIPS